MENINTVKCTKCGTAINVQEALYTEMQAVMLTQFNAKVDELQNELKSREAKLAEVQKIINNEKEKLNETIQASVKERLSVEKRNLEVKIRSSIENENADQIKSYQDQLQEKTTQVKLLNKLKAEHERLKREKAELAEKLEAEAEVKLSSRLIEERNKIKSEIETKNELKLSEREMIIQQLKDQLKIAQQKAEQGSMQLQGEVQELAIEEYLTDSFPADKIDEVKKGVRGGDCLHFVNHNGNNNAGIIYYESKRTKDFQMSWLEKFKGDMRAKKATFGVIVTERYPKGMQRMGMISGIWVCTFDEFKGLCFVLREAVVLLNDAYATQDNQTGKMEMLYKFLTSHEFKGYVEALVEGFTQMQMDLLKEKRSLEAIWKQREKQIQTVLLNTTQLYSAVKGIAGNSISSIKALELPEPGTN